MGKLRAAVLGILSALAVLAAVVGPSSCTAKEGQTALTTAENDLSQFGSCVLSELAAAIEDPLLALAQCGGSTLSALVTFLTSLLAPSPAPEAAAAGPILTDPIYVHARAMRARALLLVGDAAGQ